jgi:hypothetical protein
MNFAEGGRLFGWMQKARRESSTFSPSAIDFWHRTTYSRHTLISIRIGIAKMPDEDWIKTLEDGRKVKFVYQELPEDGALTTAQLARIFIPEFHLTVVCRPHTCRERSTWMRERAWVGRAKATASTRAKWRSSTSACCSVLRKLLDTADIVREAIYRQSKWERDLRRRRIGIEQ